MNKRWLLPFVILLFLAGLGLFMPTTPYSTDTSKINAGDTAWMLTATGLVLLMTPGLSFFMQAW